MLDGGGHSQKKKKKCEYQLFVYTSKYDICHVERTDGRCFNSPRRTQQFREDQPAQQTAAVAYSLPTPPIDVNSPWLSPSLTALRWWVLGRRWSHSIRREKGRLLFGKPLNRYIWPFFIFEKIPLQQAAVSASSMEGDVNRSDFKLSC